MTTILLAKKLLLRKTSKVTLEQIQFLKMNNMREIAETNRGLQKLRKYGVLNRCRLCLRSAETNLFKNKAGINYADDVKNILDIEVKHNDGKPQFICEKCIATLRKAVELKQTADVSSWRLNEEGIVPETASNELCVQEDPDDDYIPRCRHKVPNGYYGCKRCQENAKKPRSKKHRGPFVCEVCGLKLRYSWRLKQHMQIHTQDFNYSCKLCSYRTRHKVCLQVHERSHTGDRPYLCVQCHATFISASNLASHKRTHLPPTLKCADCDKGFKFKEALHNHIATQHRSTKPFNCSECGNSYATRNILRRHQRRIHNLPKIRQGAASYIKAQDGIEDKSLEET